MTRHNAGETGPALPGDAGPRKPGPEEAAAEAARLRQVLHRHNRLYYVEAAPEISDSAYDALFRRLLELEAAHPSLVTPDSPTQRVGAEPLESLPGVEHAAPMLSLDSAREVAEVRRFDERLRKALGDEKVRYVLEPKLDGASLELVYVDGVLERAVTRGNGRVGEGVTENVRTIPTVPLRLSRKERAAPAFLSVRGEAMMYLSEFESLNQRRIEADKAPYQNPAQRDFGCAAPAGLADHGPAAADRAGLRHHGRRGDGVRHRLGEDRGSEGRGGSRRRSG